MARGDISIGKEQNMSEGTGWDLRKWWNSEKSRTLN